MPEDFISKVSYVNNTQLHRLYSISKWPELINGNFSNYLRAHNKCIRNENFIKTLNVKYETCPYDCCTVYTSTRNCEISFRSKFYLQ